MYIFSYRTFTSKIREIQASFFRKTGAVEVGCSNKKRKKNSRIIKRPRPRVLILPPPRSKQTNLYVCSYVNIGENMVQGRCMKCQKNVEIKNGKEVTTKNKRKMLKGVCGACGTVVCRFLKG